MKLHHLDAVYCKWCGGTYAPPHDNEWGLCATCWHRYCQYGGSSYGHVAVTETLIKRVLLAAQRYKRGVLLYRCEAVSHCRLTKTPLGYQCGNHAQYTLGHRRICHSHKAAKNITFVDEMPETGSERFLKMMLHLASLDPTLPAVLQEVINRSNGNAS